MNTTDSIRSARWPDFQSLAESWTPGFGLTLDALNESSGPGYISNETNVLFYLTGLTGVPNITTNTYLPGAIADHLTSYGGQLLDTQGGQMSILSWLEAGATASFGTVEEPCAYTEKFPQASVLIPTYFAGATLIEAYWKSVAWPGEGIFIGEPLANPWGKALVTLSSNQMDITVTWPIPGRNYQLQMSYAQNGPFTVVQDNIIPPSSHVTQLTVTNPENVYYRIVEGPAHLTSIAVTPADNTIVFGTTQQMTATGSYSDGTTADITSTVTWSRSGGSGSMSISSSGLVSSTTGIIDSITVTATEKSVSGNTTVGTTAVSGDMTDVVGDGQDGDTGNGGAATSAKISSASGMAIDPNNGNIYIADTVNNVIRMVPATSGSYFGQNMTANDIYTIAGTGTSGYSGDGAAATSAKIDSPTGIAVDPNNDNVYIADKGNNVIRMLPAANFSGYITGDIYTVAGTGAAGYAGDHAAASSATLHSPAGIAVDSNSNVYIADTGNNAIRMVAFRSGSNFSQSMTALDIYTIAGTGTAGYSGDSAAATSAMLNSPTGVTVDYVGNVYVADQSNNRIRMVTGRGGMSWLGQRRTLADIYTIAGTGTAAYSGDRGAASSAAVNSPYGVTFDSSSNNLYIADTGNKVIRMITLSGGVQFGQSLTLYDIYTIAGTGTAGSGGAAGSYSPGTSLNLGSVSGVAVDPSSNVYFSDLSNYFIYELFY